MIDRGSSGGPLVDLDGKVIGINSRGQGRGIGFTIPVDTALDVMRQLDNGGIERGWLGVSIQPFDRDLAAYFGVPDADRRRGEQRDAALAGGAAPASSRATCSPTSPARRSKPRRKKTSATSSAWWRACAPGESAQIALLRGRRAARPCAVTARSKRRAPRPRSSSPTPASTPRRSPRRSCAQNRLATRRGAYVSFVASGSPAAEAGLEPGDVIRRVEGQRRREPRRAAHGARRRREAAALPGHRASAAKRRAWCWCAAAGAAARRVTPARRRTRSQRGAGCLAEDVLAALLVAFRNVPEATRSQRGGRAGSRGSSSLPQRSSCTSGSKRSVQRGADRVRLREPREVGLGLVAGHRRERVELVPPARDPGPQAHARARGAGTSVSPRLHQRDAAAARAARGALRRAVRARSSGMRGRWCRPPCTTTRSRDADSKGSARHSASWTRAGPVVAREQRGRTVDALDVREAESLERAQAVAAPAEQLDDAEIARPRARAEPQQPLLELADLLLGRLEAEIARLPTDRAAAARGRRSQRDPRHRRRSDEMRGRLAAEARARSRGESPRPRPPRATARRDGSCSRRSPRR